MKMNCLPDMRRLARRLACLVAAVASLAGWTVSAATLHVWPDSPNPMPPYTNWTTAARFIQDAVDAAQTGDTVLVTNGVYSSGGRAVGANLLVNRTARLDRWRLRLRCISATGSRLVPWQDSFTQRSQASIRIRKK